MYDTDDRKDMYKKAVFYWYESLQLVFFQCTEENVAFSFYGMVHLYFLISRENSGAFSNYHEGTILFIPPPTISLVEKRTI
jgi:hypothetical protein